MSSIKDCPFCGIEQHDRIISAQELCISFLSNPRLMEGHALVIPRRHIEDPRELNENEILAIFKEIKRIETALLDSGLCTGCDIRQHFRPFLTQGKIKVDHVHFHILPRILDDSLYVKATHAEVGMFAALVAAEKLKFLNILQ